MIIAVIGAQGVVGGSLSQYFAELGHTVIGVDRSTKVTLEVAAAMADITFIATLPIQEVFGLMEDAASVMQSGTLLVHGTSIANPAAPYQINVEPLCAHGVTVGHVHLQFRPEIPLAGTMRGQNVSTCFQGNKADYWKAEIEGILLGSQAVIHPFEPGEHDRVTSISQLVHMTVAATVANIWTQLSKDSVMKGIKIGGPPCRSLVRSVVRTCQGGKVASDILVNHPETLRILKEMQNALEFVRDAVTGRQGDRIAGVMTEARAIFEPETLRILDNSASQLARLDADMRATHFEFNYSKAQNITGLLADILREFDMRGVDKTSTIAQVNPDGGCTIRIAVQEVSAAALDAEQAIRAWG